MRRSHSRSVVALLLLINFGGGVAAFPLQGPGTVSCANFAKTYKADPETETIFYTWAQGFWSSMNMAANAGNRPMRELGGEENRRALRVFCADNPLKDYMDGVLEIYQKLPFSQKKAN